MHYSRTCLSALSKNGGGQIPERQLLKSRPCWWQCGVLHLTIELKLSSRQRGRAGGGRKGVRVSDSGIRQLVQAAWLEADLIVRLSFHRHLGAQASSLFFCSFSAHFSKWIVTIKFFFLPPWTVAVVLFLISLPWHCCRDGGLLEEFPLSAFCLQKEG